MILCSMCKKTLPFSEYHRDRSCRRGWKYKCKRCSVLWRRNHWNVNPDVRQEHIRQGSVRAKTKSGKQSHILSVEKWKDANKIATKAQRALRSAIKRGNIVRQPCEVCGEVKSHGHHDDYSKPFAVIWLCSRHHKARHIYLNERQAEGRS